MAEESKHWTTAIEKKSKGRHDVIMLFVRVLGRVGQRGQFAPIMMK